MLPDYLRSEKEVMIPSHGPANSFQCWVCQAIRIQMEETFIIVTYNTLPEVTAPEKHQQDINKAITKEIRRQLLRTSYTHSQKPVTDWVGMVPD